MSASVKSRRNFGTKNHVEVLRLRLVAGELGKRVGDRIREARLEKEARLGQKFGQRQLAELVAEITGNDAIDNQRISDWERGVHQPNDENMRAIAQALDKPVAWFYDEPAKAGTPDLMGALKNGDQDESLAALHSKVDDLQEVVDRIEGYLQEQASKAVRDRVRRAARQQRKRRDEPPEDQAAADG